MSTDTTTTTTTTTNDRPEYTMNRVELTEEAYDFGNYPPMYINGRPVGPNAPTYFIAELSCNHGQDYKVAEQLVQAAYEAGADAVKLQTLSPETITIDCDNEYFQVRQKQRFFFFRFFRNLLLFFSPLPLLLSTPFPTQSHLSPTPSNTVPPP
eukprot:TRINITY_DN10149_c0_g1_i3.p1 TRINITY_DN10149_c0_g1~~TRINITY_DN10149_c0_g1_i3.p1  ORF type:complete len:177 (+),score=18.18 TRINITY_DN10149_c0_g1_i3:73-531(+)